MKRKIKLLTIMTIILATTLVMVAAQLSSPTTAVGEYYPEYIFQGKVYLKTGNRWIRQNNARVRITIEANFECPEGSWVYGHYHWSITTYADKTDSNGYYYAKFHQGGWPKSYDLYAYMYFGSSIVQSNGDTYTYIYYASFFWGPAWNLNYGVNSKYVYMQRHTRVIKEPTDH